MVNPDLNLINVQIILEPSPLGGLNIWIDPGYEASIKAGIMDLGRTRWEIPAIFFISVSQHDEDFDPFNELESLDNNDIVISFFTLGKLP